MKVTEAFADWGEPIQRNFDALALRGRFPDVVDEDFWSIAESAYPYTLLSLSRMFDLYQSVRYVCEADVPGDLVECGVLLGGAAMIMAEALLLAGDPGRRIFLYDTFRGSPHHGPDDVDIAGAPFEEWSVPSFRADTERNLRRTSLPFARFMVVEGPVDETIPRMAPGRICLLHLDTDTYSSTSVELDLLYPRLVAGGVLLVDDYGYCLGCRRAVDEYFHRYARPLLLHRVDFTGRSGVKA